MKRMFVTGLIAAIAMMMASPASAQAPQAGKGFILGYRAVRMEGTRYSHDTHPDDWFLPNSSVPGSAGTTGFDDGVLHFAEIGFACHMPVSEHFSIGTSLGGLFGGTRNEHKNWNDNRPDANGAFVYSKARLGIFIDASVTYHFERFFVGMQGTFTTVFVDSGWDRYGMDESVDSDLRVAPTIGPVIGWMVSEDSFIKATIEAGKDGVCWSTAFNISF